jgi:hypothetical protein
MFAEPVIVDAHIPVVPQDSPSPHPMQCFRNPISGKFSRIAGRDDGSGVRPAALGLATLGGTSGAMLSPNHRAILLPDC